MVLHVLVLAYTAYILYILHSRLIYSIGNLSGLRERIENMAHNVPKKSCCLRSVCQFKTASLAVSCLQSCGRQRVRCLDKYVMQFDQGRLTTAPGLIDFV